MQLATAAPAFMSTLVAVSVGAQKDTQRATCDELWMAPPSAEVGEFLESEPLVVPLVDLWRKVWCKPPGVGHLSRVVECSGCAVDCARTEDLATPVNLPLGVSFTDTDPAAGSYGGVVPGLQIPGERQTLLHFSKLQRINLVKTSSTDLPSSVRLES